MKSRKSEERKESTTLHGNSVYGLRRDMPVSRIRLVTVNQCNGAGQRAGAVAYATGRE